MWFKIKCGVMLCIVILAIFLARGISKPLWENSYDMSYESNINEEVVSVGAFGEEKTDNKPELREDRIPTLKEMIKVVSDGTVPLLMYLLSVLCLVDLIKSTYEKFNKDKDLVDKTLYVFLIIGQMSLIGLISYYVATISFEILIIWILFTLVATGAVYLGPSLVSYRRRFK